MGEKPKHSRLPAPKEMIITKATTEEAAELIEKGICYVDKYGNPVHLHTPFVEHWKMPREDELPPVVGVSSVPLMLRDKTLIGHDCPPNLIPDYGPWLDRRSGIVFDVPDELLPYLPKIEDCTGEAVAEATHFLCDEWLIDVATSYQGKCVLIACALTVIERLLLPARPAFFFTAGRRSTGKTTTAWMLSMALRGKEGAGSPFDKREEERRKAIFSYLYHGLPMLFWDNIALGSQISSPALEAALTSGYYADRVLGVSEIRVVPASTIQIFTGNNIGPKGDMASRSLIVLFVATRPDPENRQFTQPYPVKWTDDHRGEILGALYTILLGNPALAEGMQAPTRFKEWWEIVGSAVEHAAKQHLRLSGRIGCLESCSPQEISFRELFGESTAADEQDNSVSGLLTMFRQRWPEGVMASDVAAYVRKPLMSPGMGAVQDVGPLEFFGALGAATGGWYRVNRELATTELITKRLKTIVGNVVAVGDEWLKLHYFAARDHKSSASFKVEVVPQ